MTGLQQAIIAVAQATLLLGTYYKDHSPSTFLRLLELRNRAQWISLSVKDSATLQGILIDVPTEHWCLFEIVRLTLLAYNNLVIYPLSPTNEVEIRLALELKLKLETSIQIHPGFWNMYPTLFLWVLMLGGISDATDMERRWYKQQFHLLSSSPQVLLLRWSEIERALTAFLWQDNVLNEEAIKFWMESPNDLDLHVRG